MDEAHNLHVQTKLWVENLMERLDKLLLKYSLET